MEYITIIEDNTHYPYCQKDKIVFRVPENSPEIKCEDMDFSLGWGEWRTFKTQHIICPKCSEKILIDHYERYPKCCSYKERFKEMWLLNKISKLEKKISQMEYAPPDGRKFLKILNEAKNAGDFA